MEYLISNVIKIHPLALTEFDEVEDDDDWSEIDELTRGYEDREEYFVGHVTRGIATIGSNDLTQLVLGVSRDAERLSQLFDEEEASVKAMIRMLIERAHGAAGPVGLCGEAPSTHLEFAAFLVEADIDSISVAPDSVHSVCRTAEEAEESRE